MTGPATPAADADLTPTSQFWRAALVVLTGVARAARDLDLISAEQSGAMESAAREATGLPISGSLFTAAIDLLADASGMNHDDLRRGLPLVGLVSGAAHVSVARALREQLLTALYRLENRPWDRPQTAVLIARGRRRVVQAAESLREVAIAGPSADPRDSRGTELAARALGYVNRDTRSQLKQTTLALEAGGTGDAFLECDALLGATLTSLQDFLGPCLTDSLSSPADTPTWWEAAALTLLETIGRAAALG